MRNKKTDRWDPMEKKRYYELFRLYGRDYKKISDELGSKTEIQCRILRYNTVQNMRLGKG